MNPYEKVKDPSTGELCCPWQLNSVAMLRALWSAARKDGFDHVDDLASACRKRLVEGRVLTADWQHTDRLLDAYICAFEKSGEFDPDFIDENRVIQWLHVSMLYPGFTPDEGSRLFGLRNLRGHTPDGRITSRPTVGFVKTLRAYMASKRRDGLRTVD